MSRLVAPTLIGLGGLLAVVLLLLPVEERWSLVDAARNEHVTSLGRDSAGQLHAGTQSGRLWRHDASSGWESPAAVPSGAPITVLVADGDGLLVGTASGLYRWRPGWESLLDVWRIGHVQVRERWRVVATGNRVLVGANGDWVDTDIARAIGDTSVYRVLAQPLNGGDALHAGTVGLGVWLRLPGDHRWLDNSRNLPAETKVFALALTGDGLLLAGTDQGLYWQASPLLPWQRITAGLGSRRVLDLALWERADGVWLLAASDDGVYRIELLEQPRGLETRGLWQRIPAPRAGLDRPVSWIVPAQDTVWIAAGSIYRLDRERGWTWRTGMLAAGLLVLAGLALAGWRSRIRGLPS